MSLTSAPLIQKRTQRRGKQEINLSKGNKHPSDTILSNMRENPIVQTMLIQMFNNLMGNSPNKELPKEENNIEELKEKIVESVLKKIGIPISQLDDLCSRGKGHDIISSIEKLEDSKAHDFLIAYTYNSGAYGYIHFTGNYIEAKKHALLCLAKDYGVDGSAREEDVLIREFPVYTIGTDKVKIEVLPHASWISMDHSSP